jgi:hypothetical protein
MTDNPDLAAPNDNEIWAQALERTRHQVERRMLHKEVLDHLVRRFVDAYMREANPDTPGTDMSDEERDDLRRGIKEKWAVIRAAEYYERDERTIREIMHPSNRSRPRRTKRTKH